METFLIAAQVTIALGLFNVWILRFSKPSPWRGGNSRTMAEEFEAYGLPAWAMRATGALKLIVATGLIVGLWVPGVTKPAMVIGAILMAGAVFMHLKIRDPLFRSAPAAALLTLCLVGALS